MSLIHWWPLNGDYYDKIGNNNIISTGTTFTTNGKFGNAVALDSDSDVLKVNNLAELSALTNYSMACWVYLTGVATNHSSVLLSSGNWNAGTEQVCFALNSYSSGYRKILIPNGQGWSVGINLSSENKVQLNKWYHIAITYDGTTTLAYINGKNVGSYTGGGISSTNVGYYYLGAATYYAGFTMKGYMNNFRIYDHALSLKEVKELSKALAIHYTFEDPALTPNIFNTAIFLNDQKSNCTVVPYGSNGFKMTSTGSDPYIGTSANSGAGVGSQSKWDVGSNTSQVCLSWRHVSGPELNKNYMTFLNSNGQSLNTTHNNLSSATIIKGDQRYAIQTLPAGTVKVHARFGNETLASGSSITVDNVCLKIGNNSLYSLPNITNPLMNNVISSANITAKQNIYASSDARIGQQSLECKGNTIIDVMNSGDITDGVTASCWIKLLTYPTSNAIVFADYNSKLAFGFYGTENAIISCGGYSVGYVMKIKDKWASGWNHVVVTRAQDGTISCYLNGVKLNTSSANNWTSASGHLTIGGRLNGSYQTFFNGLIDDFRIYNTILSTEDIQELYKTTWSANRKGQVFTNKLNEDSSSSQKTRTGIQQANYLSEVIEYKGGFYLQVSHHNNKGGTNLFSSSDAFENSFVYHNDECWSAFPLIKNCGLYDGAYEFIALEQLGTSSNIVLRHWKQTVDPFTATYATAKKDGGNFTALENIPSMNGGMYKINSNTFFCITNASNGNWYGAFGSWSKFGSGIPTFNNGSSAGIFDLFVRVSPENAQIYREFKNGIIMPNTFNEI